MPIKARTSAGAPVRFLVVGIVNTFAGLAVIYVCKWALSAPDLAANLAGYMVGLAISYILNARWTFAFRGRFNSALGRFAGTVLVGYLANLAVVSTALRLGQMNGYLAQAVGVAPYALVMYLGSRYYVFAETRVRSAASASKDVRELK
jgi:putative flippase GtrA